MSTVCSRHFAILSQHVQRFRPFEIIEFYVGISYFKMYIVLASIASSDSCGLKYLIFLEIGMSVVCKIEFL